MKILFNKNNQQQKHDTTSAKNKFIWKVNSEKKNENITELDRGDEELNLPASQRS